MCQSCDAGLESQNGDGQGRQTWQPPVDGHGRLDSALDSKMPVLDAGLYEGLLSMEASFAALSDSSRVWLRDDGLRFRASSGRPFRTWLEWFFSMSPRMQAIENSMAETIERFESMFTSLQRCEAAGLIVSGQLRRLWQRRVRLWRIDDALQSGLSWGVLWRTSLTAIRHCWRRCWDVCNPSKPRSRLWRIPLLENKQLRMWRRACKPSIWWEEAFGAGTHQENVNGKLRPWRATLLAWLAGVPDRLQFLESSVASMAAGCSEWCRQSGGTLI